MFTPIFLHLLLLVFSVVSAVDGRDQCIDFDTCGTIPDIVAPLYNMSCITELLFTTFNYTILWNDGSYTTITVITNGNYNRAKIRGADVGKVTDGRFKGSDVTLSFFLNDQSNGCESGNGASQYSGNVQLLISRGSCGPNMWRYCAGFATFDFNPPLTKKTIPVTIGTDRISFDRCFGSCK